MIDPENHPFRDLTAWPVRRTIHASPESFLSERIVSGLHVIMSGGLPIDLHVTIESGAPAVVVLNGYFPREKGLKLPVFSGFGVVPGGFGVTRICISDPALHLSDDIGIGWYAGQRGLPLQKILPLLIRHVLDCARARRILFLGGSAGGFTSLFHAADFPGSRALVWNPQTDIRAYSPDHVIRYARLAFGAGPTLAEAREVLDHNIRPEVLTRYPADGVEVTYLQNRSDWHADKHMRPFLASVAERVSDPAGPIDVHLGDWGQGHVPPPKDLIQDLIRILCFADRDDIRARLQARMSAG